MSKFNRNNLDKRRSSVVARMCQGRCRTWLR